VTLTCKQGGQSATGCGGGTGPLPDGGVTPDAMQLGDLI
jgi:hypothetical protein